MLDLDSGRWDQLKASPGGTGRLAADLLRQVRQGDGSAFSELHEQICHQFTVGEVAYAAVPQLVDFAASLSAEQRLDPLRIVAWVAAGRACYGKTCPPIPPDLAPEFEAALPRALALAAEVVALPGLTLVEVHEWLGVLASLQGCGDLGTHLLMSREEYCCPSCGEEISYSES